MKIVRRISFVHTFVITSLDDRSVKLATRFSACLALYLRIYVFINGAVPKRGLTIAVLML